jgi:NAD(P)-dependent dehydrogenase (short-subunit alcohol dehydrogenase family)
MSVTIDLTGQVVLVTGGARGVGLGITRAFLDAGALAVSCGRNVPDSDTLPTGVHHRTCDVKDADQVRELVDGIVHDFGRLDVVVNNAGGAPYALADNASPRFSASIVGLNLLAPLTVAQAANRVMRLQPSGGSIINISSESGHRASPGTAAYGAAKAGLINLTRTLAIEWAPKVRVNCVVAGMIATEAAEDHYGGAAGLAAVAATVPLGRMGTPEDVAGACLFLSSPLASYVSGAAIEVHGGGEGPAFLAALQGA